MARLLRVDRDGRVSEFFTAAQMPPGLPPFIIPNGLDVDSQGNAWVSDFATAQLFRVSASRVFTSLVVGPDADSVGGLVYDEVRAQVFYSSTGGVLRRLSVAAAGAPMGAPVVLAQFDDWVSGVQFGAGNGWDRSSLYVSSIWGKVWRVPVGVGARRRP